MSDLGPILRAASSIGLLDADAVRAAGMLHLFSTEMDSAPVIAAIRAEPGLSARVLRVANSAYYGQSGSVASIERAISVLGMRAVRSVAATGCFDQAVSRRLASAYADWPSVQRHSVATAILAEEIARLLCPGMSDLAFTAGLLHDLGVPLEAVLDLAATKARLQALRSDRADGERDVRHAHLAATVVRHWNLPEALALAVAGHHDDARPGEGSPSLPVILKLATQEAARLGYVHDLEPNDPALLEEDRLMLTRIDLERLESLLRERLEGLTSAVD